MSEDRRRTTSTGVVLSVVKTPPSSGAERPRCIGVLMIDRAPAAEGSDELVPISEHGLDEPVVFPLGCCQWAGHHEMDPCVDDMGIEFWPDAPTKMARLRRDHVAYRPDHEGVVDWQGVAVTDIREVLRG